MVQRHDPNQGLLFGDDSGSEEHSPARRPSRVPLLAPLDDGIAALAAALPKTIALGTSSWSFPGWRGAVWDREVTESTLAREGLRAYSAHPLLRTVGIDKTYYRPAPREEFERLRAQVPRSFRFLVKAHEALTRRDAEGSSGSDCSLWLDAKYAIEQVIEPVIAGLGDAAGPIVLQFSPMGLRSEARAEGFIRDLGAFLGALPQGPLYGVEVRDRILLRPSWSAMLADTGCMHCYSVHPSQPPPLEQAKCVEPGSQRAFVGRWMLHSGLSYHGAVERYEPFDRIVDPDPGSRMEFARLCVLACEAQKHAFVIINNKAEGSAPRSVRLLAQTIVSLLNPQQTSRSHHE
ncbi:MAG: DUF72 domain-containing protein [Phycisphaerales bacterium]|nr:DUF72 domain-containing protein [Phycisphaerales bacterium]